MVTSGRLIRQGGLILRDTGSLGRHEDCCCVPCIGCGQSFEMDVFQTEYIGSPILFPAVYFKAKALHIQTYPTLDCTVIEDLCGAFTHQWPEYSPSFDCSVHHVTDYTQINLMTVDVTFTVNLPVHVGIETVAPDDYNNIWVDGVKRFESTLGDMWNPLDGSNCVIGGRHWFVTTLGPGDSIRVQSLAYDTLATEIDVGWFMRFWYNGDPAPGAWPNNLCVSAVNN